MTEGPRSPEGTLAFMDRLVRAAGTILSGSALAQVISLAAFAVLARAVSLEALGGIAIIQGTARAISGVGALKTGLSLTRFGTMALSKGHTHRFLGLIKAGYIIDGITALVMAGLCAFALAGFAHGLGVPPDLAGIAPVYALAVLCTLPGPPLAILRALGRYGAIAATEVSAAIVRLALFIVAWLFGAGAGTFLLIWLVSEIAVQIVPHVFALRLMRRGGYGSIPGASAQRAIRETPGFRGTLLSTNVMTSLRAVAERGDVVLVGALAGPTAAGLLRIAKSVAEPMIQLGRAIQEFVLPELARLWSEGQRNRALRRAMLANGVGSLLGALAVAVAWMLSEPVVRLVAGAGAVAAAPAFILVVAAQSARVAAIGNPSFLITADRNRGLRLAALAAVSAFVAVALWRIPGSGAVGGATAFLAHNVVWLVATSLAVWFARPTGRAPEGRTP